MSTPRATAPGIFLLALALRLVYLAEIKDTPYFNTLVLDAEEYDVLAEEVLQGHWLLDHGAVYVHGPLYPYVLALLKLCGSGYTVPRVFQAILGAFSCVLVYRVAGYLFAPPVPLIAGLLAALYWPFLLDNGELLATTLIIFIQLNLVALLLRHGQGPSLAAGALAGALLGLLAMGHSDTLLLLPVLLGWFYGTAGGTPARRAHLLSVFSLAFLLTLSPFLLRNLLVQGSPLPFQGSWSFYMGNNPAADGTPYARQGLDWQRLEALPIEQGLTTPAAKGRFYLAAGLAFIRQNPSEYACLLYRKFRLFWNAFEVPVSTDLRYLEAHAGLSRVLVLRFGSVAPLALAGMIWGWRRWRRYSLLYGFVLTYLGIGLLFSVCARYRLPAVPFLLIFAGHAIWQMGAWVRARDVRRGGAFLLLLAAAFALVHTGVDEKQVDHLKSSSLLGHVFMRTQQYDLAEQAFLRELREFPGDSDAYNSLGAVCEHQGRQPAAETNYFKAIEVAPDHARPRLNLGNLYLKQHRLEEARATLEEALDHDPRPITQYEGCLTLGYVYLAQQAYTKARDCFLRALEARKDAQAYYGLANACARLGQTEAQIHALELSVQLEPTFAPAYRNLGALYLQKGDLAAAEKTLLLAIRYEPGSAIAYENLGALYLSLGQPDRAREALAAAERLRHPDASPSRGIPGNLLLENAPRP